MKRPFPVVIVLLAAASAAYGSGPAATTAGACHVSGKPRAYGPTYVTSLRVSGTSCANGVKLVRGYYKCRVRNGGRKGHCGGVYGYRCKESRRAIKTQFDALVKCGKGSRRIDHRYTQFT